MHETNLTSINLYGNDFLLQQEIDLIIRLRKDEMTDDERQENLKRLEAIEEIRRMRANPHLKNPAETGDRTNFLPGGNVFCNQKPVKDGLPAVEVDSAIPPEAQSNSRRFLPGNNTVFHNDHRNGE